MSADDRRGALNALRQELRSDPTNLGVASRYWKALGDVGCGRHVVEAFRGVALNSRDGVVALANAYRELFESSGEAPRAEYFDEDLIRALRGRYKELAERDRSNVSWILASIVEQ